MDEWVYNEYVGKKISIEGTHHSIRQSMCLHWSYWKNAIVQDLMGHETSVASLQHGSHATDALCDIDNTNNCCNDYYNEKRSKLEHHCRQHVSSPYYNILVARCLAECYAYYVWWVVPAFYIWSTPASSAYHATYCRFCLGTTNVTTKLSVVADQ